MKAQKPTSKPTRKPRRRFPEADVRNHVGHMAQFHIANPDPSMHYVWALAGGTGVHTRAWYEFIGYQVVVAEKDGVTPAIGKVKGGAEIVREDFVLMAIPAFDDDAPADLASIEEYGIDGQSGQAMLDSKMAMLKHGRIGDVDVTGVSPAIATVTPSISELSRER